VSELTAPAVRRSAVGLALRGLLASVVGVALVPVDAGALLVHVVRGRPVRRVLGWEARRLGWVDGRPRTLLPRGGAAAGLLAVRSGLGVVCAGVLVLVAFGLVVAVSVLVGAITGGPVPVFDASPGRVGWITVAFFAVPGLLFAFLAFAGLVLITRWDARAWEIFTQPDAAELERQVSRLNTTLTDVVAAVDIERRRIERDLHDGVQQRVVALSLLLARSERARSEEERQDLHRRARAEAQQVLDDLRAVSWRIHPPMLEQDGLATALEALADRIVPPLRLHLDLPERSDPAVESAAYFLVSEAVTNATKHAGADQISIEVLLMDVVGPSRRLVARVSDDGRGGADPTGSGLAGIAARVAAVGGSFHLESPPGGPTIITAEIPCASPSPRTRPSSGKGSPSC